MTLEGSSYTFVAGIDEAGLGPLLGPLCLGFSILRVSKSAEDEDPETFLWDRLDDICARAPERVKKGVPGRLVVADSKVVHARNARGEARLESTALAFQRDHQGVSPRSGRDLLFAPPPGLRGDRELFDAHPWYGHLPDALPFFSHTDALSEFEARLSAALEREACSLSSGAACLHPAGSLNRSWRRVDTNKSLALWEETAKILRFVWEELEKEPDSRTEGLVTVDRQGGRRRYAELLRAAFPGAEVRIVSEATRAESRYEIIGPCPERDASPRLMQIRFAERAEQRSFAVALASCYAKYARELSMRAFNNYFESLQPGLRPTAGYVQDGRRWIAEARPALERAKLDPALLIRER
ncbi:MAG: hypothetical protein AAF368_07190 [Planctomycetota bacterium]